MEKQYRRYEIGKSHERKPRRFYWSAWFFFISNHLLKQFSQVTTPKSFMTGDMPTEFFLGTDGKLRKQGCTNCTIQWRKREIEQKSIDMIRNI